MQTDANRRVATLLWAGLVSGGVVLLGVALFLAPIPGGPPPEVAGILLLVAAALSVVTTVISWLWAVRMPLPAPEDAGAGPPSPGEAGRTRLVIAAALCEGPSLAALVFYLLTGDARILLPFALSFGALLAHFPGERHWARLCGTGGRAGPGPGRMVRE